MKLKSSIMMMGLGVCGTLAYQNYKNGNMKEMYNKIKNSEFMKKMM